MPDHPVDPDDVTRPITGPAPGVVGPVVGLPVLNGDPLRQRLTTVRTELGKVFDVMQPVGIPPVGAAESPIGDRLDSLDLVRDLWA